MLHVTCASLNTYGPSSFLFSINFSAISLEMSICSEGGMCELMKQFIIDKILLSIDEESL